MINEAYSSLQPNEVADAVIKKTTPICSLADRADFCDIIDVNVRIDGESSSVYFASTDMGISEGNSSWKIRPYARKEDEAAMGNTREWSVKAVKNPQKMPQCTRNHSVPAILFSTGGYAGNHFHDFTDVVIPLFVTAREFNGEVQFLITDTQPWWVLKYQAIISKLSKFDIINIDKETQVHCFPRAIVGLKRDDKELRIDPKKHSYSMRDFKEFLRSCYSLKRDRGGGRGRKKGLKPQLLIVARRRTRSFTNTEEIRKMARKLGFKVIVMEPDVNVKKVAEIVNSCDVMMGVHGAGLANIVFLPKNAVFIQIVPFGSRWAKWLSKNFFGEPSKDMELKYLEYNMSVEESTLIQQYPKDDVVLRDPQAIQDQGGWRAFKSVYFVKQNVNLDINRFRPTLLKALELLQQ
ncbi:protein O-linked-mannose beta-1,4-N-acetylglucosaminyltransferase 2-like [Momordica charantia]|uniref:Protein O-linked-mannose beta-1,4-N-acetylglucosaminyltransferase 2-like n=1 Tax=Momordica charantia TaxID=3673 RepID=A0A6J1C7Y7_MOMCH|nr:protein O-linked-mannose beta-1,4-N-acetylglucosaminyltransferase 2-like [Momordica charantia]